ncbi:MAG: zinc-binding alcohol dehydrogenase family protein [Sporolactobacillus sp.]
MKAAVLHRFGEIPRFEEFPDPLPGKDEVIIHVKAVVLDNIVRETAKGSHFASCQFFPGFPSIVGLSGIGELPRGKLVGFGGVRPPYGTFSEKTVVASQNIISIPDGVDPATAAAMPSAALASLLPIQAGAKLQKGETVWINGATGVAGKLAVQIAKLLGAGRIIATGRNEESMRKVRQLGADLTIDLKQDEEQLIKIFRKEIQKGCDIILDFLWGHVTEWLIQSFVPKELNFTNRRTRLIEIGEKAGPALSLSAESLRTTGLEIFGGTAGLSPQSMQEGTEQVWEWIRDDKLQMDIDRVPLKDIEKVWQQKDLSGKRVVIVI